MKGIVQFIAAVTSTAVNRRYTSIHDAAISMAHSETLNKSQAYMKKDCTRKMFGEAPLFEIVCET